MTILKNFSSFFENKRKLFRAYSIQIAKEGVTMYNKVEICGVNTAKLKTLSAAEKDSLLKRAHNGDSAARDELIVGNLKLVLSVIQKFNSRGENPDDLFQVGCVGLIKAVDNFDVSQNVLFSTYAVPMNILC